MRQLLKEFNANFSQLHPVGLDRELSAIQKQWVPISEAAKTLVEAGPRIAFINGVSAELEENIKPIQSEFAAVVRYSAG